jgi:hypothetical protein
MTKINIEKSNHELISFDIANSEFQKWADAKRLPQSALNKHEEDKEIIIEAIQKGYLSLDDELCFVHKLSFPLNINSEGDKLSELRYKFRVTKGELSASTKGLRADNLVGEMSTCYISCLTEQPRSLIRALDSTDSGLAEHIAAFFLI